MFRAWIAAQTRKRLSSRRPVAPVVRLEALEVREVLTLPIIWAPELTAKMPVAMVVEQSPAAQSLSAGLFHLYEDLRRGDSWTAAQPFTPPPSPAQPSAMVPPGAMVESPTPPPATLPQPNPAPGPTGSNVTPEPTPPTAPAPEPAKPQPTTGRAPTVSASGLGQSPTPGPLSAALAGAPAATVGGPFVAPPTSAPPAGPTRPGTVPRLNGPVIAPPEQDIPRRTDAGTAETRAALSAASDGLLLRRFADTREQAAFTELVRRHGRTVHAVCSRVLGDADLARDASQATFLALARRAGALEVRDSLAGWLYRVAGRMALRVRATSARQRRLERVVADQSPRDTADALAAIEDADAFQVLREELTRLPAKYRVPIELCYLGGRTHAEVAVAVGLPRGSVAKRIGEGLDRLREGIAVRGVLS